jgi:hypothetical protein
MLVIWDKHDDNWYANAAIAHDEAHRRNQGPDSKFFLIYIYIYIEHKINGPKCCMLDLNRVKVCI